MNNFIIRKLEDGDITNTVDIWYETSLKAHDFIPKEYWESNKETMKTTYIPMSETFVASKNNEIVGFVSLLDNYLAAIFVKVNFQGDGVGSALIKHAKSIHNNLELKVFVKNKQAVFFYKSKGFIVEKESLDEDTGEKEFHMKWHK